MEGPAAGLALLDALEDDDRIAGHYRLSAARAHLLERAGELDAARASFLAAAEKATSAPERDYLLRRGVSLSRDRSSRDSRR